MVYRPVTRRDMHALPCEIRLASDAHEAAEAVTLRTRV